MDEREISQAVIGRLPRYYRYLGELKDQGRQRISSRELSGIMKVTASQIRQDFNNFGGFGQQGYGYNVDYLYNEIGKILGIDKQHRLIIVGAGRLGQALINYGNFGKRGFVFKGAFDIDQAKAGKMIRSVKIYPLEELEDFVRKNRIDIAVLTLPTDSAVEIGRRLVACGIKAILNFAHVDLDVPPNVQVENVHILDSMMKLSYNATEYEKAHGG